MPDRQLLILDLDETLVYASETLLPRVDFVSGPYQVVRRPFVREFVAQAAEWFDLAVWTSSSASYAAAVVGDLFGGRTPLRFAWSRSKCTQRYDAELGEFYWVKTLAKVRRIGFALERVLVLDDTRRKYEQSYGNLVLVRPFFGDPDDTELRDVLPFLEWLRSVENVRSVEKRNWRDRVRDGDLRQGRPG